MNRRLAVLLGAGSLLLLTNTIAKAVELDATQGPLKIDCPRNGNYPMLKLERIVTASYRRG